MLYRNGENLKDELIQYLSDKNNITIYVPYIKASMLKELLNAPNLKCDQIIVRWEPRDLASGASDLEIYEICKNNDIALYMNNSIHLKLYTDNFNDAFLGSANISERAISSGSHKYNYEICCLVPKIDRNDRLYLHKILNDSILINDEIYHSIKQQIPEIDVTPDDSPFKIPMSQTKNSSDFLISKLPMTDTPDLLWDLYSEKKQTTTEEQENCLCHDLMLYDIKSDIDNKADFINLLSDNFLNHPFITKFLKTVDGAPITKMRDGNIKEGLQFGTVKEWFKDNTTTVPTPRSYELTQNVQILYTWIEYLSNGLYTITVPGRFSQVLKRNI